MKIFTGYFAQLKKYREHGLVPISIARFKPRYVSGVSGFMHLAPTAAMLKMQEKEYDKNFNKILAALDADEVVRHLELMSGNKDCVLLCYEKIGDRCHRHMVADWFNKNGIYVKEFGVPEKKLSSVQQTIF